MAKPFRILHEKMSPEAQAGARAKTAAMLKEMCLHELRNARELTQKEIAETMNIRQAAVSRMERRADMYIGTLRKFISSMGGSLDIIANFPDGSVRISELGDPDGDRKL